MRSSSLKLLQSEVDNPREFRDKIIHDWFLTSEEVRHLHKHLLSAIPVEEFFDKIEHGQIQHGDYAYQVVWIHKAASVKKSGKAIVSFRYCKFLNCGYALVKKNNIDKDDIETVLKVVNPPKDSHIAKLLKRSLNQ